MRPAIPTQRSVSSRSAAPLTVEVCPMLRKRHPLRLPPVQGCAAADSAGAPHAAGQAAMGEAAYEREDGKAYPREGSR